MKAVAGTLKLDLAQFRELEAFATFGSELDAVSKAQLERGYRLVELLKQPLNSPMPVEEQVVSIFAGTKGYLDDVAASDVGPLRARAARVHAQPPRRSARRPRSGGVPDELADAVEAFKAQFRRRPAPTERQPTVDPTSVDADELGRRPEHTRPSRPSDATRRLGPRRS